MKSSSTKRLPVEPKARTTTETDWDRLDRLSDDDIRAAARADPDAVPTTSADWAHAKLVLPPGKKPVTLRLDRDVLDWFQRRGHGYQTRINAVLRAFVEAQEKAAP